MALALAQVDGMQAERGKMKRRVSKLSAFYNSGIGKGGEGGVGGGSDGGGGEDSGSGRSGYDLNQLVARLDEQANETSDLRANYHALGDKLEQARAENARLMAKMSTQQHAVRDVERQASERAQDMSELMSQIGNVVHVQGRAAAATSGDGLMAPPTPSNSAPRSSSGGAGGRNAGIKSVSYGYGGHTDRQAAGLVGGLGAAVEQHSAQSTV